MRGSPQLSTIPNPIVSTGFQQDMRLPMPCSLILTVSQISNQKLERNVLTLPLRGSPFSSPLAGSPVSFPDAAALSPSAMNQPKPSERKRDGDGDAGATARRTLAWFGLVWFSQDLSSRLHTAAVRLDPCAGASDSTLSTSEAKISPQNLGEPWWKS
jgi:hypothetical protein